jgi:exopolysaccharide production protein ExoZ
MTASMAFPLPPGSATEGVAWAGERSRSGTSILDFPSHVISSIRSRINAEYYPAAGRAQTRKFLYNPQLLRLISAYAIVYIHMSRVASAAHIDPAVLQVFRFGTDLFVVLAGFLTAHVLGDKPAGAYLLNRLIRIVPLYWMITILAFLVQNYAMTSNSSTLSELFMSLSFIAYGPFPVLYPAWTLTVIVEFSLIIAVFQLVSRKNGILYSAAFAVLIAAVGQVSGTTNPTFVFYTNPIITDFALGILIFKFVSLGRFPISLSRRGAIALACAAIVLSSVAAVLRPFAWPELPRLIALGLPMAIVLLSVITLERLGVYTASKRVSFLAKCTYAIYLTHWFVAVVSEKIVVESGDSAGIATVLLIATPVVVTYVAVLVYVYIEAPLTRHLSNWLTTPR